MTVLTHQKKIIIYQIIIGENLEGANVDIARVALDMNLIQRGINATQGIIDNIKKIKIT